MCDCVVYEQYVFFKRGRMDFLKPLQKMEYGRSASSGDYAKSTVDVVVVKRSFMKSDHVVLLLGLLIVVGNISGLESFG